MCELFGLSGGRKVNIVNELKEFYSHAPENPNGWGLFLDDGGRGLFCKEDVRADKSRRLEEIMKGDIWARDAIAHIRLATIGYDEMENTHPFRGYDISEREWIFAHNGTIFESDVLNKYTYEQDGETDSERIFLYILDSMNEAMRRKSGPLDADERFDILQQITAGLAPKNKLNLLIYDGEMLYVHSNYRGSLYERREDGYILFSTRPLQEGKWDEIPFTRLLSYKDGESVREGTSHDTEYIPDECSINALYLAYSGL